MPTLLAGAGTKVGVAVVLAPKAPCSDEDCRVTKWESQIPGGPQTTLKHPNWETSPRNLRNKRGGTMLRCPLHAYK